MTIHFKDVSAIIYSKIIPTTYIAFQGVSAAQSQSVGMVGIGHGISLGSASANPYSDPYGIVFKSSMYNSHKIHYQRMNEIFEEYKRNESKNARLGSNDGNYNPIDMLKRLKEIKDQGIITEEEFNQKRKDLLSKI